MLFCILEVMKIQNYKILELQAEFCSVMSNPKRLAICQILDGREVSVSEIAEILETSISTVSQHLRLMKDKNIVASRKEAQTVYYSLRSQKLMKACSLIREVLSETLKDNWEMANELEEKPKK
jgi:ArsR family transcriptional regulator